MTPPYGALPGPRGRLYLATPHFVERWTNRTLLEVRDIPAAVLTARVYAVSVTGVEAMYAPAERRVLIAKPCDEGRGFWVLLTVLYPPDHMLRHLHTRGTRAAAFWELMDRNNARQRAAGAA